MIEPEVAFCDLGGIMDLGESLVKSTIENIFKHCETDLVNLQQWHSRKENKGEEDGDTKVIYVSGLHWIKKIDARLSGN